MKRGHMSGSLVQPNTAVVWMMRERSLGINFGNVGQTHLPLQFLHAKISEDGYMEFPRAKVSEIGKDPAGGWLHPLDPGFEDRLVSIPECKVFE